MKRHAKAIVAIQAMLLTFALGASVAHADNAPTLVVEPATQVGVTGAEYHGTIDPNGPEGGISTINWYFLTAADNGSGEPDGNWYYGGGGEITAAEQEGEDPGDPPVAVHGNVANGAYQGLEANTTYYVRLVVEYENFAKREETGAPFPSFKTKPMVDPMVAVGAASNVRSTTAHLSGTVDPEGGNENPATGVLPISVNFEVSTDGGDNWAWVGAKELTGAEAAGTSPVAVEIDATGLPFGKAQVFRLVVSYGSSTRQLISDPSAGFETLTVTKPEIVFNPITGITGTSAHLSAEVDPTDSDPGFDSNCRFELITDAGYQPRDEKQRVTIKASGGTFTLEHEGQTTAAIAYNAPAATVQAALEGLASLDPGDVTVSGGPGNLAGSTPYLVTFVGANPPGLNVDASALTGPGQAQVTTLANGFFSNDEVQYVSINAIAGTFTLGFEGATTPPIAFDATPEAVQAALEALATIGVGNVAVTGGPGAYMVTFVGNLGDINVKQITANGGALAGNGTSQVQTTTEGHAAGFEGATVIPCDPEVVSGGPAAIEQDLTGLEPATTYHVQLRAENLGGVEAAEQSFTTSSLAPTAITHLVADLRQDSAYLSGFVDPQNEPTTYRFEWGTQANLAGAQSLPTASAGSGGQQLALGRRLSGLSPDTTYYYRIVSDSPTGPPTVGQIRSFTTRPPLPPMGAGVGAWGDRAYELVSTPDKQYQVAAGDLAADGEHALYYLFGGTDATSHGGPSEPLAARRTPTGWVTFNPIPTAAQFHREDDVSLIKAISSDYSSFLVEGQPGTGRSGPKHYARFTPATGRVEELFTNMGESRTDTTETSADLGRVVVKSNAGSGPFNPGDPVPSLYDIGAGGAQLLSLLPGDAAPACGVTTLDWVGITTRTKYMVSTDGRRVFFTSQGSDCSGADDLYMRQAVTPTASMGAGSGASTTLISGPALSGPDANDRFEQAAADGSWVIYSTATRLRPDDTNSGVDVYRYTVGAGNDCLTCGAVSADVETVVAAIGGSRVYFTSRRALAPGAIAGQENIYVWRQAGDQVAFVAPGDGLNPYGGSADAITTPSGSTLLFVSKAAGLDGLTGRENGDWIQRYRYDDRDGSIECLSCPAAGPATGAAERELAPASFPANRKPALTDDGRTVVFTTAQALVPADVNAAVDVYEWRDGRLGLISDGKAVVKGAGFPSALTGLTADGRDVQFQSWASLTPEVREDTAHLYDARIGGGFPQPVPPAPCGGDGCQGAPTPPPPSESAGTAGLQAAGNPPVNRCGKAKVRRAGRCVSKKASKRKGVKKKQAKKKQKRANDNRRTGR